MIASIPTRTRLSAPNLPLQILSATGVEEERPVTYITFSFRSWALQHYPRCIYVRNTCWELYKGFVSLRDSISHLKQYLRSIQSHQSSFRLPCTAWLCACRYLVQVESCFCRQKSCPEICRCILGLKCICKDLFIDCICSLLTDSSTSCLQHCNEPRHSYSQAWGQLCWLKLHADICTQRLNSWGRDVLRLSIFE